MADNLGTSDDDGQESAKEAPVRNELVSSGTLPILGSPEQSLHERLCNRVLHEG